MYIKKLMVPFFVKKAGQRQGWSYQRLKREHHSIFIYVLHFSLYLREH